ncbi:chemotaxis protein CheW [Undibacterium sp. 5I1]|uniref:chemotaxis protein CheW n=1 Tax=unclassified Undibacterium TaxID=2630295 RepID=UPI002AB3CCAC|nr:MULTISPECIES: chemotaxis protein CheW [unclassified Undibacterium]MDY7540019.1 chemotaxis protein CheW [Undibacterium sp. 5I1]MEB0232475.1 chemotaxis protein CheW [Undibacterium sp. 10I3]MEB0257866.1 chemotaxis protein CheW [Undibacterium sp. 5I1]
MYTTQEPKQKPISSAAELFEFLTFRLGGEEYGIDIQTVQELRGYGEVTRIANSPNYIKGVINLRGNIVPIIDMRTKFNLDVGDYDQFTVVIILNIADQMIGIVVDSVTDVVTLSTDQIKPAPTVESMLNTIFLTGLGILEQRMLILVDIEKLILSPEFGVGEPLAA